MPSTDTVHNGEIDISVVLPILGKDGPPPYDSNGTVPPSLHHLSWIDLTDEWPIIGLDAQATTYDDQIVFQRATNAASLDDGQGP